MYLKVDEIDKAIKNYDNNPSRKNIAEYNKIYNELLQITKKQSQLYLEISQYRDITLEQQEKGFL